MLIRWTTLALCAATLFGLAACEDELGGDGQHQERDSGKDGGRGPDAGRDGQAAGRGGGGPQAGSGSQAGRGGSPADGGMDSGVAGKDAGFDAGPDVGPDASNADAAAQPRWRAVTIRFRAKIGDDDFVCGQTYPGQGSTGTTVKPKDFRFYVMDLRLVNPEGDEVPVVFDERLPWQIPTVALLDFENGECETDFQDADLNAEITGEVPEGDYEGVVFANGVPEDLNHDDPATLPAPLQKANLTWGWLLGFRFMKAELVQVVEPPAIPGNGWAHPGSTACTGTRDTGYTCARQNRNEIRLEGFDPDEDTIVADVGALFAGTDLTQDMQCHGTGDACGPMFERLGIDYATGKPLQGTQQVYRVE